ncbi:hypothetical protein O6H91_03G055400 [Diphasiastrum complanatum]|nr:hypothetical protein O6H91_03G055400 [Diphasiastrum complanatum]
MTVNSLAGFGYVTSLFGAFIGDAYLGRYWSGALFLGIYLLGSLAVAVLTYLPAFTSDCTSVSAHCLHPILKNTFFIFLYISALGLGGYQPCVTALGADQFDDGYEEEKVHKVAFFNWYYVCYNTGFMLANVVIIYIEDNYGYPLGFALSSGALGLAVGFFLLGTPLYRHHRPSGNAFLRVGQVVVATVRKWHVQSPSTDNLHELYEDNSASKRSRKRIHSRRFRFLDKAATVTASDNAAETDQLTWHLCTVTQVEEVKCLLSVLPVWIAIVIYGAMFAQMNTFFVEQSALMNTQIGTFVVPSTYIFMFDTISVYIWTIIYENIIQPVASRRSGLSRGLTGLQRIGIGLVFIMLAMAAAALVEKFRREFSMRSSMNLETDYRAQISVLWQIPQYALVGASEVFTYMGQLEFFYDQAPDAFRGIGSAISLAAMAGGSYLSNTIIFITTKATSSQHSPGWLPRNLNEGKLDVYFWVLSFICLMNCIYFVICAQFYQYTNVDMGEAEDMQG